MYDDGRFRDQIALLEIDIVALEMMVLRVLSAEKSGKQSLDVAGLLKIRGSEIQQRYTELMMLAAGPCTLPFVREAMEAGWQGDLVRRFGICAPLAGNLLQLPQDHDLRRQQRSATQHRGPDRVGLSAGALSNMDLPRPSSEGRQTDQGMTSTATTARDAVRAGSTRASRFERRHAIAKDGGATRDV